MIVRDDNRKRQDQLTSASCVPHFLLGTSGVGQDMVRCRDILASQIK